MVVVDGEVEGGWEGMREGYIMLCKFAAIVRIASDVGFRSI